MSSEGWRTARTIQVKVELRMVLVSNRKSFGFFVKTNSVEILNCCTTKGYPFTKLGLDIKKAEPRLPVQIEISAKLHFF